jgi:hypothetical protein
MSKFGERIEKALHIDNPKEPQAQPPATTPTEKHYTPLMEIKGIMIGRCAQVLPNKLQCWRAGDFLVQDNLPSGKVIYQLCRTHVTLQKLSDRLDREKIAAGESIQVPAAYELPQPPTTLEALQKLEGFTEEPQAVYPPPIVLSADQLQAPQMAYGTPLAESLTQPTPPALQKSLEEVTQPPAA